MEAFTLEGLRDFLMDLGDRLEDEGDRVFLGSTNDADRLRDYARALDATLFNGGLIRFEES